MSALDQHAEQILLTPAEALAAVTAWELQGTLLALALRRIETSGTFGADGSVSMKAWLREHARMTDQGAGDLLATGRFLDNNGAFAEAAVTGHLSGGQISLARRLGKPKYSSLLAQQQRCDLKPCAIGRLERPLLHSGFDLARGPREHRNHPDIIASSSTTTLRGLLPAAHGALTFLAPTWLGVSRGCHVFSLCRTKLFEHGSASAVDVRKDMTPAERSRPSRDATSGPGGATPSVR
ncbi:MAG: hypothetical protein LH616_03230, partial [Ilumatobacteraceae bacterium]|nr:hypothetical protein [Ilumatobacteraceae bacterium]